MDFFFGLVTFAAFFGAMFGLGETMIQKVFNGKIAKVPLLIGAVSVVVFFSSQMLRSS